MPELTICMPSRRNFEDSRAAIESALEFCEKRDAVLIVADNSEDEAKKSFWEGKSPRLKRIESGAENATDNMMLVVQASDTPFIILMGDDDLIVAEEGIVPLDLADLSFDYVGVFPATELFISRDIVGPLTVMSLEQDDASLRLKAYFGQKLTHNGGFYSIFRREFWLATMDLFYRFHPTRAGFTDWALAMSMFTAGKMASDPSLRYRYNVGKWATRELIIAQRKSMFAEVGLPETALKYEPLFKFLDFFVLANRAGSPLSIDERQSLADQSVYYLLSAFISQVANSPEQYEEGIGTLAEMVLEVTDSLSAFQLGLLMIERAQPGLKDKYVAFIQAAISGA